MLCCIQNVIEKTLQMSERTFIVFIDYSKAFDSVSHLQMFDILNDMGFPRHIVALIQALYEKQSAIVRWNGAHTKPQNQALLLEEDPSQIYVTQTTQHCDVNLHKK